MENVKVWMGVVLGKWRLRQTNKKNVFSPYSWKMLLLAGYSCVEVEKQNLDSLTLFSKSVHLDFWLMFSHSHTYKTCLQLKWGWCYSFGTLGVRCLTTDATVQVSWIALESLLFCEPDILQQRQVRFWRVVQNCHRSKEVWKRQDCPACAGCSYERFLSTATPILVHRKGQGEVPKVGYRWR